MIKVAVLCLDWNENISRDEFMVMSNEEVIELCESEDMIFSLNGFQECINEDVLSLGNSFIRFIEIKE